MAERRFIDANNLIEEIREERCYNCRNFKDMKCDYCGTADYIYMIEDMPAADVAPVVHRRWIDAYPDIEPNPMFMYGICSECGFEQAISKYLKYCPNCGAKMDEPVEDDNGT